jgi:hypothetical protein
MRLTYASVIVLGLLAVASPAFAQSARYTNADLGRSLSSNRITPDCAVTTWLDHTDGIAPSYGTPRRAEAQWIVGPTSDWNPPLSVTAPLAADAGVCYGCEFASLHHGWGLHTIPAPRFSSSAPVDHPGRAPSRAVVIPAAASHRR